MGIRIGIVVALVAVVGLIAAFTAGCYALAALFEGAFSGGARIANVLSLMLVGVMVFATLLTLAERKWSALMQDRVGPNRARIDLPWFRDRPVGGLWHIVADAVKLLTKEDHVPPRAGWFLFNLAPILAFAPVFCLFAVVPVAPPVEVLGRRVALQVAELDVGLLFVFAIASLAVFGTALAGWSSNNKLALLGGVRASSQMIAYEIALGLSLVGTFVAFSRWATPEVPSSAFNALRLEHLVSGQAQYLWQTRVGPVDVGLPAWGLFLQPIGFVLFFAAAFAETKRAPFDMPEGESEIIGYFIEFSGMRFGMFMISEFIEIVVLSAVTASVFLGGYHLPFAETWLRQQFSPLAMAVLQGTVFWLKVLALAWLQLAIRWTFPRFRYDQVQRLGWKMLLPLGLVNIFVTGALVLYDPSLRVLALLGLAIIAVVAALALAGGSAAPERPAQHSPASPGH